MTPAERMVRAWRWFAVLAGCCVAGDLALFSWTISTGRTVVAAVVAANATVMAVLFMHALSRGVRPADAPMRAVPAPRRWEL